MSCEQPPFTAREAAHLAGVCRAHIDRLAQAGRLAGEKVGLHDGWLLDRASVEQYASERAARRERPPAQPAPMRPWHLPAEPLLRQLELHGGAARVGVGHKSAEQKALERAKRDGWLTVDAADRLAVRLFGLSPYELWGEAYGTAS